jgi:hypothetical protein
MFAMAKIFVKKFARSYFKYDIRDVLSPPLVQFRKEMNLYRKHCCPPALECASIGFR